MRTRTTLILVFIVHAIGLTLLSLSIPAYRKNAPQKIVIHTKTLPKTVAQVTLPSEKPTVKAFTPPAPIKKVSLKKPKQKVAPIKPKAPTSKQVLKKIAKPTPAPIKEELINPNIFIEKIATIFQESLTLPEKGHVKLTITVQANGKIVKVELVESESQPNLEYLKAMLPSLCLPAPDGGKDVAVTITFCND